MQLIGVLETTLDVRDLTASRAFYEGLFCVMPMHADGEICAYDISGRGVFILFQRGRTGGSCGVRGRIPAHDGRGTVHMAFSIRRDDVDGWLHRLESQGVAVEGKMTWPRGGTSTYFLDPDGHLIELATPGLWPNY